MELNLVIGRSYVVSTATECTVTDALGRLLCSATAGQQQAFVANTSVVTVSDDAASVVAVIKGAPALGGGGGSYTLTAEAVADVTPLAWGDSVDASASATAPLALTYGSSFTDTSGTYTSANEGTGSITIGAGATTKNTTASNGTVTESSNAVTIGCKASNSGVDSVVIGASASNIGKITVAIGARAQARGGLEEIAIGYRAQATGSMSVSLGGESATSTGSVAVAYYAQATGSNAVAIGAISSASSEFGVAVGHRANSASKNAVAVGRNARAADYGVVVHRSTAEDGTVTQLYFSGANTPLATTYEGGAPMLGYTVTDSEGNVTAAGTRSLLDLLTNNSTFAPATTDENGEWVMPTVFHPSDLDLPHEEVTEPTEEEYTPLPVYPIIDPELKN